MISTSFKTGNDVAIGTGGSSAGYRWKYSTDTIPFTFTKKTRLHTKRIDQYDLDMKFIKRHKSITDACVQVPGASIYWSFKNSKPSRGFFWKYVDS